MSVFFTLEASYYLCYLLAFPTGFSPSLLYHNTCKLSTTLGPPLALPAPPGPSLTSLPRRLSQQAAQLGTFSGLHLHFQHPTSFSFLGYSLVFLECILN